MIKMTMESTSPRDSVFESALRIRLGVRDWKSASFRSGKVDVKKSSIKGPSPGSKD